MALTQDVKAVRYGVPDPDSFINQPLGGSVTVYGGTIALTDNTGNVKNSASPMSTDTCWGIIFQQLPGQGVAASSVASTFQCQIDTGTFFLASGAGSDQLSQSTVGSTVYVINETTVGLTSGGGGRPVAGRHMAVDTVYAAMSGAVGGYAIKLGNNQGTGGSL